MTFPRSAEELIADASKGVNSDWFVETQVPLLRWLSQTDEAGLKQRLTSLKEEQATDLTKAQVKNKLVAWIYWPLCFVSFALSVQVFGRLATLANPVGFPDLGITFGVFAPLFALFISTLRRCDSLNSYDRKQLIESLEPIDTNNPELVKLTAQSRRVREWLELVTKQQKRSMCKRDLILARYLAMADSKDEGLRELYAFQSNVCESEAVLAPEVLLERASQREQVNPSTWEFLNASEDALLRKEAEVRAVIKKYDRYLAYADKLLWLGIAAALLAGGVALWRIVTLTAAPSWIEELTRYGLIVAAGGASLLGGHFMATPAAYNQAQDARRALALLDNNGVYDMLDALQVSPSAQSWHKHVVHTLKRQFRWQDMYLVRALVDAEKSQKAIGDY